ncbi:MAG: molybdopterin-dependent oxidoreductase [Nitrososphaeria archaeon]|nr:molybdopterin-dependent oxidoreductase [Nitrososphaeria archaeon]NIQ33269.1 molybdopterin-dependent oxidoreductase [Nitrososphaeria archaeon]
MANRRDFLKVAGAAASLAVFGLSSAPLLPDLFKIRGEVIPPDPLGTESVTQIKYSVCLQCHSACGIRCKVVDGRLVKIDGNPYHPNTLEPHIPYDTDPVEALNYVGTACAKGQAGIETLYDPYRVKSPMKRAGPRGSGLWKTISWEQAITEIVEGGLLPGAREGEPEYVFEGLKDIRRYISKDEVESVLGVSIKDFVGKPKGERDTVLADLSVDDRTRLEESLIDINKPELGPKSNQLVHMVGRAEHGRKEFTDRFFGDYMGTLNMRNDHTDICELSHHVGINLIRGKDKAPADLVNCQFLLLFGSSLLEAGFPFISAARKTITSITDGHMKLVVVDPRLSNTANSAHQWIPIIPGADGALAMGMLRWIIEYGAYDKRYLGNANKKAAIDDDESTWSDATYLVNTGTWKSTNKVVDPSTEEVVEIDPQDDEHSQHGVLEPGEVVIDGVVHKTAFTLLKESAYEYTMKEYASASGVEIDTIETLAREFTSHGKSAVAHFYRGPVQHTNGIYNALAISTLNTLIGNTDWRGGIAYGGHDFHEKGDNKEQPYPDVFGKGLKPGRVSPWGIRVSRAGAKYEETTEFTDNGYPAKRPWFPLLGKNLSHVCLQGIADQYPHPIKAVFITKANFNYSTPGMRTIIEDAFTDSKKVPLFVAFDIIIAEFSSLADYIFPDGTYLEQWATPHVHYHILTRCSGVRQPVVDPIHPDIRLEEDVLINIGKKMGLPGYGKDGFGPGMNLNTAWDWYEKPIANIGWYANHKDTPGIKDIGDEQGQVNYMLARGGAFEPYEKAYDEEWPFKPYHKWGASSSPLKIYIEKTGTLKDSMTGKLFPGVAKWVPVADAMERTVDDPGFSFTLITYKIPIHTQSRTVANPLLMEIWPENWIEMNRADAERLGIKNKDIVRMTSKTNMIGVTGKAKLREGIRPGVVAVSHNYGHWQYGASPNVVDGSETGHNPSRAAGVQSNEVMRLDESIGGTMCLTDKIGGSASFYDTKVNVEKA